MDQRITSVSASGLHGYFDFSLDFEEGVNIVYGVNGSGKTTLLHILANAVNLELPRFKSLQFNEICLCLSDSKELRIVKDPESQVVSLSCDGSFLLDTREFDQYSEDSEISLYSPGYAASSRSRYEEHLARARQKMHFTATSTYFPAFRTMIEAWNSVNNPSHRSDGRPIFLWGGSSRRVDGTSVDPTYLARQVFGDFVPTLNYPSPFEIERKVNRAIRQAFFRITSADQYLFPEAFIRGFGAVLDNAPGGSEKRDSESIIQRIEDLAEQLQDTPTRSEDDQFQRVYNQFSEQISIYNARTGEGDLTAKKYLSVFEDTLHKKLQVHIEAFETVEHYVEAVNRFLEGKKLVVAPIDGEDREQPELGVRFNDGRTTRLLTLSSGERQVIGLIYAASQIGNDNVILIDEPELSLHIDWQRKLLDAMLQELPHKQLIVCTHSPIIGAAFEHRMIELQPTQTQGNLNC